MTQLIIYNFFFRHGGASGRPSSTSSRKHTSGAPRSTVIGASGRYKRDIPFIFANLF